MWGAVRATFVDPLGLRAGDEHIWEDFRGVPDFSKKGAAFAATRHEKSKELAGEIMDGNCMVGCLAGRLAGDVGEELANKKVGDWPLGVRGHRVLGNNPGSPIVPEFDLEGELSWKVDIPNALQWSQIGLSGMIHIGEHAVRRIGRWADYWADVYPSLRGFAGSARSAASSLWWAGASLRGAARVMTRFMGPIGWAYTAAELASEGTESYQACRRKCDDRKANGEADCNAGGGGGSGTP